MKRDVWLHSLIDSPPYGCDATYSRRNRLNFMSHPAFRLRRQSITALTVILLLGGCARQPDGTGSTLPSFLNTRPAGAVPPAQSVDGLRAAAVARPDDAFAQARYADAAERAGQFAAAATALTRVITLDGATPERAGRLGGLHLRARNLPAAESAFLDSRNLSPRYATAHAGLALTYELGGDRARAQEAWRQAVAMAPNDWTIRGNQALSLVLAGRAAEAERSLGAVERQTNVPQRARHNMALVLQVRGQHERTVRLLRMEMGPTEAEGLAQEFAIFAEWLSTASPGEATLALFPPASLAVAAPAAR